MSIVAKTNTTIEWKIQYALKSRGRMKYIKYHNIDFYLLL